MKRPDNSPDAHPLPNRRPALIATVLYEDFQTGIRANAMLERIIEELKLSGNSDVELLRFDLLQNPLLCTIAAQAASRSELVVFSAHDLEEMPENAGNWLREWLDHKADAHCAFVILLDQAPDGLTTDPISAFLQQAGPLKGVELFYHYDNLREEMPVEESKSRISATAIPLGTVWDIQREVEPMRGSGLND